MTDARGRRQRPAHRYRLRRGHGHDHRDHRHRGIGSAIARQLASGGEALRLSSADTQSARRWPRQIGRAAVVAADNRDALRGADAVVLALRFTVLKGVIDEIAGALTGKVVVVPSNPVSRRRARQRRHGCFRTGSPPARS